MTRNKADFWKLQLSLKYQHPELARKYDDSQLLQQFHHKLERAFSELHYEHPGKEAELLMVIMGGLFSQFVKHPEIDHQGMIDFIKLKYALAGSANATKPTEK